MNQFQVVKKSLRKRCKCHGMSGSCTIKSCWIQLAPLRDAAFQLRKRYDRALRYDLFSSTVKPEKGPSEKKILQGGFRGIGREGNHRKCRDGQYSLGAAKSRLREPDIPSGVAQLLLSQQYNWYNYG